MTLRLTILGQCVSLKNSRPLAINRKTGKHFPAKNSALKAFEADFLAQVPPTARKRLTDEIRATVHAFYSSRRPDLSVEAVYDLLQRAEVIANDRQIKEKHEFWHLDAVNPRVEIELEVM